MNSVFEYLSDLSLNNNREWYHANKVRHQQANAEFEHFVGELITANSVSTRGPRATCRVGWSVAGDMLAACCEKEPSAYASLRKAGDISS